MDAVTEFHSNIHKSFISSVVESLEKRFESDGFSTACNLENVHLGQYSEENINIIPDLYRTDIVSSKILSEMNFSPIRGTLRKILTILMMLKYCFSRITTQHGVLR